MRELWGWGAVAGAVCAVEWVLARSGQPLLSHVCWQLHDTKTGAGLVAAATATVAWHLNVPRRKWRDAIRFGTAVGTAVYLTQEDRRGRG